jgi:hypothetical protein
MRYARLRLPSSGSLGSRFPAFSACPVFSHRYYARLRLPFLPLGSLHLKLASRYLVLARLGSCPLSGSLSGCEDAPTSAWPCSFPGMPHRFSPQGDDGPLKFPGYPCMHMPRSSIPVVSSSLALALRGLLPSGVSKPSAFPGLRPVIPMNYNHTFSGLSHAACALATPGFIHTLADMHAGSLQIRRLTSSRGNWALARTHWVTVSNFTASVPIPRTWV